jgi:hypothetical protein
MRGAGGWAVPVVAVPVEEEVEEEEDDNSSCMGKIEEMRVDLPTPGAPRTRTFALDMEEFAARCSV